MGTIQGKVVLVTGAAGGIGAAAALLFATEGAQHVALADRDGERLGTAAETVREAGGSASTHVFDVTDEPAVAKWIDDVVAAQGRIDCAFNNAGINLPSTPFHEMEREVFEEVIAVNLTSVFLCLKHELRQLVTQGGGGAIVNTSSGAGLVPAPGQPHYTAAKHGILGLTRQVAREYLRHGIRCNAILPGITDTPMLRGGGDELTDRARDGLRRFSPIGELLEPADVAATAVWLCSDAARRINGQSIVVDGGGILH
ncbi:MAG: SDR family oxidoreductase [Actinobacteria bacterium]|nr:SDR family oxidoreductase [Actinomycetota bacterium]